MNEVLFQVHRNKLKHSPSAQHSERDIYHELHWQETEIDPRICKISKNFFKPLFSESPHKITGNSNSKI